VIIVISSDEDEEETRTEVVESSEDDTDIEDDVSPLYYIEMIRAELRKTRSGVGQPAGRDRTQTPSRGEVVREDDEIIVISSDDEEREGPREGESVPGPRE
jgi:hypothetical protein